MGLEGIQPSPCPQHPAEAQEGRGLEQMCVEPALPWLPSPWTAATPCHLPATALGLGHALSPGSRDRGAARPHRLRGRRGRGALPALSAGPDCEQLRADKERWRWAGGRRLLALQSKLALPFPSALRQQPGCLLGRESSLPRGKSGRVADVRAGTRVTDFGLLQSAALSHPAGVAAASYLPRQGKGVPQHTCQPWPQVLLQHWSSFIGRLCLALMSCTALIAI